jgi:hypothetical protein
MQLAQTGTPARCVRYPGTIQYFDAETAVSFDASGCFLETEAPQNPLVRNAEIADIGCMIKSFLCRRERWAAAPH